MHICKLLGFVQPDEGDKFPALGPARCKIVYLLLFGALGSVGPFYPVIYKHKGFAEWQIGVLSSIRPVISFLVAPVLCALADHWHRQKALMSGCMMLWGFTTCSILTTDLFPLQALLAFLHASVSSPITTLMDSAVIQAVGSASYGPQRLWGAVGWGCMTLLGGVVADTPLGWGGVFSIFAVLAVATFWVTLDFHFSAVKSEARTNVVAGLFQVLRHPDSVLFFITVILSGVGAGLIDTFLFVRLEDLGGSGLVMGVSRFITCAAEVPAFLVAGKMIERLGVKQVVVLAQLAYVVRFLYYSLLTRPWVVLPCELLHGLTFAAMWSATTSYATQVSPPDLKTTMLGCVSGLHWGLGVGIGSIGGGFVYQALGAVRTFRLGACLSTVATSLMVLAIWREHRKGGASSNSKRATAQASIGDSSGYELVEMAEPEGKADGHCVQPTSPVHEYEQALGEYREVQTVAAGLLAGDLAVGVGNGVGDDIEAPAVSSPSRAPMV